MVILRLENCFNLFLLIFGLTRLFTILRQTYFVEKVFLINFCSFFIDIASFFVTLEKKNRLHICIFRGGGKNSGSACQMC